MKFFKLIILALIFGSGCLVGYCINNFPFVKWNHEVKIYEVFQVLSTLFIGIALPLFIKKWIEDGRIIKSLLKEETGNILSETKKIHDKFLTAYTQKQITPEDKQFVLFLFSQLENLLDSFEQSLKFSFGEKYNVQFQDLKIAYYNYWKSITGGNLMDDNFVTVDLGFISFQTNEYNLFSNQIRTFVISLQKI